MPASRRAKLLLSLLVSFGNCSFAGQFGYEMEAGERDRDVVVQTYEENKKLATQLLKLKSTGVELLTMGAYSGAPESIFGHTLLRFLDDDDNALNDVVVGFEMLTMNPATKLANGFNGGAANIPVFRLLSGVLIQYHVIQQRTITRQILPVTDEMISSLKKALWHSLVVPALVKDYKFLDNNCSTALLKALGSAGIDFPLAQVDIPTFTQERTQNALLTPYPPLTLEENLAVQTIENSEFYKRSKKVKDSDPLAQIEFWRLVESFDAPMLESLYHAWPTKWSHWKVRMAGVYRRRVSQPRTLSEVFSFPRIPLSLYKMCAPQSAECFETRKADAEKIWGWSKVREYSRRQIRIWEAEGVRTKQLNGDGRRAAERRAASPSVQDTLKQAQANFLP